jgi:hypothetical protein
MNPPDRDTMETPARTPLDSVAVRCSVCGCEATARAVGDDRLRYHLESGAMIRLPGAGMTEEQVEKLHRMFLRCECCQEDHEEEYGCR